MQKKIHSLLLNGIIINEKELNLFIENSDEGVTKDFGRTEYRRYEKNGLASILVNPLALDSSIAINFQDFQGLKYETYTDLLIQPLIDEAYVLKNKLLYKNFTLEGLRNLDQTISLEPYTDFDLINSRSLCLREYTVLGCDYEIWCHYILEEPLDQYDREISVMITNVFFGNAISREVDPCEE